LAAALLIAGDSAAAKADVTAFLAAIGYDTVDAGALAAGRQFQPDSPAYGLPYGGRDEAVPASATIMRGFLQQQ
jgi:predicted dinucleotide-binding enzyme